MMYGDTADTLGPWAYSHTRCFWEMVLASLACFLETPGWFPGCEHWIKTITMKIMIPTRFPDYFMLARIKHGNVLKSAENVFSVFLDRFPLSSCIWEMWRSVRVSFYQNQLPKKKKWTKQSEDLLLPRSRHVCSEWNVWSMALKDDLPPRRKPHSVTPHNLQTMHGGKGFQLIQGTRNSTRIVQIKFDLYKYDADLF